MPGLDWDRGGGWVCTVPILPESEPSERNSSDLERRIKSSDRVGRALGVGGAPRRVFQAGGEERKLGTPRQKRLYLSFCQRRIKGRYCRIRRRLHHPPVRPDTDPTGPPETIICHTSNGAVKLWASVRSAIMDGPPRSSVRRARHR